MHRPLTTVAVAMASFSEGYLEKTHFKQLTASVVNSGKYLMNPELRAEQVREKDSYSVLYNSWWSNIPRFRGYPSPMNISPQQIMKPSIH